MIINELSQKYHTPESDEYEKFVSKKAYKFGQFSSYEIPEFSMRKALKSFGFNEVDNRTSPFKGEFGGEVGTFGISSIGSGNRFSIWTQAKPWLQTGLHEIGHLLLDEKLEEDGGLPSFFQMFLGNVKEIAHVELVPDLFSEIMLRKLGGGSILDTQFLGHRLNEFGVLVGFDYTPAHIQMANDAADRFYAAGRRK